MITASAPRAKSKARSFIATVLLVFACGTGGEAQAARFGLFVGPPGLGVGDPNPVTFTSPAEYEAQFITEGGLEFRAALIGLFAGYRVRAQWGGYASVGAGLILNGNGLGAGPSVALGYDLFCVVLCASADYFQAAGFGSGGYLSPFALRLGVSLWL